MYKYVAKWFHQEWHTLGEHFIDADNLAFQVGDKTCPEKYKSYFDSAFIKYFPK